MREVSTQGPKWFAPDVGRYLSMGRLSLAGLALVLLAACATVDVRHTLLTATDAGPVRSIAVFSFDNLTRSPAAAPALASAVLNELQQRGGLQVIDAMNVTGKERWAMSRLGKDLKADAVLTGTITEFEYGPNAQPGAAVVTPHIALNVRLVSAKGAEVLWAAAIQAKRNQASSYDGVPLEELAQIVAESVADGIHSWRSD